MFSKVFSSALTLHVGEHSLQFKSTQELESALSGKTTLSAQRTASIVGLSDLDLVRAADTFKYMVRVIGEALSHAQDHPETVDYFLRELDHSLVDEDNDWRNFLSALAQADARFGAFKLTAISKYRTYLIAGQELVDAVVSERRQGNSRELVVGALLDEPKPRQRLVFSIREILGHEPSDLEYTRIPRGEPVLVDFETHQSLSLMLAKHKFILVSGEPWILIDPTGNECRLEATASIVGRHPDADIIIFPGYRSVSRQHLLIEIDGVKRARLTDTSSIGTFAALHQTGGVVH